MSSEGSDLEIQTYNLESFYPPTWSLPPWNLCTGLIPQLAENRAKSLQFPQPVRSWSLVKLDGRILDYADCRERMAVRSVNPVDFV